MLDKKDVEIIRSALDKEVKLLSSNINRIKNNMSYQMSVSNEEKLTDNHYNKVNRNARKLEIAVKARSDIYRIINLMERSEQDDKTIHSGVHSK